MLTLSLFLSACMFVMSEAHAAPELNEGNWGIISREGGNDWMFNGLVVVKSTEGPGTSLAPNHASTETYCVPQNLRWPQIISTSPAKSADWLVVPQSDAMFSGNVDCAAGTPVKYDNVVTKTFSFAPCSTTGGSPTCPAATGTGTASASSAVIQGLKPGVYHVVAHRETNGTRSTGLADVFVRPTATSGLYVETWCYDGSFQWPRITQTIAGTTYARTWWEMAVDSSTAPSTVTCSSPKSNRVDYSYQ